MEQRKAMSVITRMANENQDLFNEQKLIEEMSELTKELTHRITKPRKYDPSKVIEELGDVKVRLEVLCARYGRGAVNARVNTKLKKFDKYLVEGPYENV